MNKEDKLWTGIVLYFIMVCFIIPLPGDRGIMMNSLFPEKRYDSFQELTEEVNSAYYSSSGPIEFPTLNTGGEFQDKRRVYVESVKKTYKRDLPFEVADFIVMESKRRGINSDLVFGLIAAESGFDPKAKSVVGAKGYMQVWPKWHQARIAGRNIYDPFVNIEVGIDFLVECLRVTSDLKSALARYNGSDSEASKLRYFTRVTGRLDNLLASLD